MKPSFKRILPFLAGLLALALGACNDSKSAATGPAAAGSFAGTTITINPTVNFLAGNALTYLNTDTGSPFPAAATATAGTYTYVPNANFTAGTLTLSVDGIANPIVLEISNFRRNGDNVTGFTARFSGRNFPVTVTGELPARQATNNTGGNTSGETRADDIPASMRGTYELTFHQSDLAPINGVPADGTETTFVIGTRTLAFNGRTLTDPIFFNGNEFEWIFKDGNIWWAVSQAVNGGLNEINVQGPYTAATVAFYGQYNDRDSVGGGYNSIGIGQDGRYVGGGFSAVVTDIVGPTTMPEGADLNVQSLTMGQTVEFTFSNNGDLLSPQLTGVFNFSASNPASSTYLQVRPTDTPAVSDTITIGKASNELPESLTLFSVRTGARTTQVTYTLEVNVP